MAAPPIRAKSAAVNLSDYENDATIERFAGLAAAISARSDDDLGFSGADVSKRSLALLTGQLRLFSETALGRSSDKNDRPFAKIPHRLFSDYAPKGALDIMLCTCLRFKASSGIRRLDFQNSDKRGFYLDLMRLVRKNLFRARLLPEIKIYIANTVPLSDAKRLHKIVLVRAKLADRPEQATHIIHPDPEGTTPEETDGTDYCRTVELAPPLALVHWWYHPDSYDSWIPIADVQGDPEAPEEIDGPQHVHIRWLDDTEMFNEWMNELDYEVAEELRGSLATVGNRQASTSNVSTKKKSKKKSSRSHSGRDMTSTRNDVDEGHETKKSTKKRKRLESTKFERTGESFGEKREGEDARRRERDSERNGERDGERERVRDRDRDRDRNRDRHRDRDRDKPRDRDRDRRRERSKADVVDSQSRHRRHSAGDDDEVEVRPARSREQDDDSVSAQLPSKKSKASGDGASGSGLLKVRINVGKRDGEDASENLSAADTGGDRGDGGDGPLAGFKVRVKMRSARPADDNDDGSVMDDRPGGGSPRKVGSGDSVKNSDARTESGRQPRRIKSSKKRDRRANQHRNPGVSFVENALPIAESEIRRIRNVSMDTPSVESGDRAGTGEGYDGSAAMDIDLDETDRPSDSKPEHRTTAVADGALSNGRKAGAPVSAADLIESLPAAAIRIPAQSRWFRMDSIHDLEKRSLPEFFRNRSASKTAAVYKTYRDFMIDTWRLTPTRYLTATAVRRHLAGDVCAILRVHAFLEHWGLLNFGVEPSSRPHHTSVKGVRDDVHHWNSAPIAEQPSVGTTGLSSGVPRLLLFDEVPPARKSTPAIGVASAVRGVPKAQPTEVPLATRREVYAAAAATVFTCDACGKDCSRMRYTCVAQVDMELCPTCFAGGQYPNMLSTRDFEQLTTVLNSDAYDGSVWSETEVLLLLEGLEKFADDWNAVAAHVKSKTNEQCVMQFLKMPIEDSFLGDQIGKWGRSVRGGGAADNIASGEHVFAGAPLPFADTANPVMAQIAFLAASVSPEVAAAAAQAALCKLMAETDPNIASPGHQDPQRAQLAGVLLGSSQKGGDGNSNERFSAPDPDAPNHVTPPNGSLAPQQAGPGRGEKRAVRGTELDSASVQASAAVALAAAASRARALADAEVREIERQFAVVIETKLGVIEEKMKSFAKMEEVVRNERNRLEQQRQVVYKDRVSAAIARAEAEKSQPCPAAVPVSNPSLPVSNPTLSVMQGNDLNSVPRFATTAAVTSAGLGPQLGLPSMALPAGQAALTGQYQYRAASPTGIPAVQSNTGNSGQQGTTAPPAPTDAMATAPSGPGGPFQSGV